MPEKGIIGRLKGKSSKQDAVPEESPQEQRNKEFNARWRAMWEERGVELQSNQQTVHGLNRSITNMSSISRAETLPQYSKDDPNPGSAANSSKPEVAVAGRSQPAADVTRDMKISQKSMPVRNAKNTGTLQSAPPLTEAASNNNISSKVAAQGGTSRNSKPTDVAPSFAQRAPVRAKALPSQVARFFLSSDLSAIADQSRRATPEEEDTLKAIRLLATWGDLVRELCYEMEHDKYHVQRHSRGHVHDLLLSDETKAALANMQKMAMDIRRAALQDVLAKRYDQRAPRETQHRLMYLTGTDGTRIAWKLRDLQDDYNEWNILL